MINHAQTSYQNRGHQVINLTSRYIIQCTPYAVYLLRKVEACFGLCFDLDVTGSTSSSPHLTGRKMKIATSAANSQQPPEDSTAGRHTRHRGQHAAAPFVTTVVTKGEADGVLTPRRSPPVDGRLHGGLREPSCECKHR